MEDLKHGAVHLPYEQMGELMMRLKKRVIAMSDLTK